MAKLQVFILAIIATALCSMAFNYKLNSESNAELLQLTIAEKALTVEGLELKLKKSKHLSINDILTITDNQCIDGDRDSCEVNELLTYSIIKQNKKS